MSNDGDRFVLRRVLPLWAHVDKLGQQIWLVYQVIELSRDVRVGKARLHLEVNLKIEFVQRISVVLDWADAELAEMWTARLVDHRAKSR